MKPVPHPLSASLPRSGSARLGWLLFLEIVIGKLMMKNVDMFVPSNPLLFLLVIARFVWNV